MKKTIYPCALLAMLVCPAAYSISESPPKITGTFSDMYFNREGGDLLGTEVHIVVAKSGYQAAVQFADGSPSNLIVVNVRTNGRKVFFDIPDDSQNSGCFSGEISSSGLRGKLFFKGGGEETISLRRKRSYWD